MTTKKATMTMTKRMAPVQRTTTEIKAMTTKI